MATFAVTNTFNNGEVADATLINQNFDDVEALVNGNIDSENIKDDAITSAKLGDVSGVVLYAGSKALSDSSSISLNWADGATQKVTLGGNRSISFSGAVTGQVYRLIVVQDATGSRTLTFSTTIKWADGVTPTLTTTANKIDVITFLYDGTNYYGSATLNF